MSYHVVGLNFLIAIEPSRLGTWIVLAPCLILEKSMRGQPLQQFLLTRLAQCAKNLKNPEASHGL